MFSFHMPIHVGNYSVNLHLVQLKCSCEIYYQERSVPITLEPESRNPNFGKIKKCILIFVFEIKLLRQTASEYKCAHVY
jgi:hypothetical protein